MAEHEWARGERVTHRDSLLTASILCIRALTLCGFCAQVHRVDLVIYIIVVGADGRRVDLCCPSSAQQLTMEVSDTAEGALLSVLL